MWWIIHLESGELLEGFELETDAEYQLLKCYGQNEYSLTYEMIDNAGTWL